MEAGQLKHRITIQNNTPTANDYNEQVEDWSNYASRVPANVMQSGSRELWRAQQLQPDITSAVHLRWIAGVTSDMQIVWHDGATDRTLNIEGPPINPDGRREEMILMCKERT